MSGGSSEEMWVSGEVERSERLKNCSFEKITLLLRMHFSKLNGKVETFPLLKTIFENKNDSARDIVFAKTTQSYLSANWTDKSFGL